jgi:multidrug efflux system membrane fusion protein
VVFSVPEDKVAMVRIGSDVAIRVWSGNRNLAGKVREVSASADPVTRTFQVKVSIDGPDAPALGSTVTVLPQSLGHVGATIIKLPTSALRQEGLATAVWVLDPRTMLLKSQPVQIATADGNEAVIASGLQPGMVVVVAGVHVLSAGQKVTLYKDRLAPAAATAPTSARRP